MAANDPTDALPHELGPALLDQLFRLWVEPAIAERGLGITRAEVRKALVVVPTAGPLTVLINDEVELLAQVEVGRSLEPGEDISLSDIIDVHTLSPANVDPNAGWIAMVDLGGGPIVAFDLRRNREIASLLVERAAEFGAAAVNSLTNGHLGPAIENGFAAVELAVKAQMLLLPGKPTNTHWQRVTWWNEWEKLGNAPTGSAQVLQRLYSERGAARYGDRPISMPAEDVHRALDGVTEIIERAREECRSST
jgi:HEPN domain-containing protein